MTVKLEIDAEERRRRVCTPEEQREFSALGRSLLANDVSLDEIQGALGYEGVEGVQHAFDSARVTTARLEQLRELARKRLGTADPERLARAKASGPKVWTPPPSVSGRPAAAKKADGEARPAAGAAEPEELTKPQQRRFRDHVDKLRAMDARFREWPLLAAACGVRSGQEAERLYEVGATRTALRNIETFTRLHAAFGSRATLALIEGVPLTELQENLMAKTEADAEKAGSETEATPDAPQASPDGGRQAAAVQASGSRGERGAGGGGRASRPSRRKKAHLTEQQHRRLKEIVDELWSRDRKLENWTLLARAAGLSSGPAMKRAYEVNSSTTTLANLSSFSRLHEAHGSRAIQALRDGVETQALEEHLSGTGAASARAAGGAAPAGRGPSPSAAGATAQAGQAAPAPPAAVDFARLVGLGQTIDAEIRGLVRASRLFEDVADDPTLPRMIRANAALAKEKIRGAIDLFAAAPEATEPE